MRNDGKMCCLGFLGKACGATDKQIYMINTPEEADKVKWPEFLIETLSSDLTGNSDICNHLMIINDSQDKNLSDREREKKLKEIFKKNGIQVTFK